MYDVIIIGAGPTGLVLANLLGKFGVATRVIEQRDTLIDYPRGVGLDDESMRTFQSIDVVDSIEPFVVPNHKMRLVNGHGDVIMANDPKGTPLGWPRKLGFLQPLIDEQLMKNLDRFDSVSLTFGTELVGIREEEDSVVVTSQRADGTREDLVGRFVVGCEGGRSFTRKWIGAQFDGVSPSTRWVVIDVDNDPLGMPNVYLGADPKRPYVSIGLPRGVRRFEFMLFDDEPSEIVEDDNFVTKLLGDHLPPNTSLDVIRRRVFTHHGRIASTFRKGHVLIAGDAAHLMPVWMGQGFNSGVRDATNLAWKLSLVVRGLARQELLDTYDLERRDHAKAMIDLSLTLGNIIKPTNPVLAGARDAVSWVVNKSSATREYFADMKFKPMPRYQRGVVADHLSLTPGTARAKLSVKDALLIPFKNAQRKESAVGRMFIQPQVAAPEPRLLDTVLGERFAVLTWGMDPQRFLRDADCTLLQPVCVVSPSQYDWAKTHCA